MLAKDPVARPRDGQEVLTALRSLPQEMERLGKIMEKMPLRIDSPYFFVNPHGKLDGRHYTLVAMEDYWNQACQDVGEDIDMYSGLKHSSCSQFVNEKHYSLDQVQMMTDHARRDSVKKYAVVQLDEKRRLLEGK